MTRVAVVVVGAVVVATAVIGSARRVEAVATAAVVTTDGTLDFPLWWPSAHVSSRKYIFCSAPSPVLYTGSSAPAEYRRHFPLFPARAKERHSP